MMRLEYMFPLLLAEASASSFSWEQALLVYGPLGLWVVWFVIRDRLDREERKQDRIDIERRHLENLGAQRKVEDAFRTHTDLLIVGLAAMKTIDLGYSALLEKIKASNIHEPK